ncbi:MAG TPA: MlaD family protein [Thermoleophilaceae bacterium]|jgi:virulence factor Mce-like protein
MRNRRRKPAITGSPVLVGAVTVLVAIVAVFVSYNANQGLPFVPTYDLNAELPNGAKLVPGNEVRAGGFRVGVVDDITSARRRVNGHVRSIAVLHMKLDKKIEPLAVDTRIAVRQRSALGLKFVEIVPGRSRETYKAGDTVPLSRASAEPIELEDVLSTFDARTRDSAREALAGFGDSLAGRGSQLNTAIRELNPFVRHLTPVMRNLSAPDTELGRLFPALGRAAAQVAPVADLQARWIAEMADTFAAIGRDPEALRETIEETPPTLEAATRSFRVQTPFLARFAAVSRDLGPATAELHRSLPLVNTALAAGVPAFEETPDLSARLEDLFGSLEDLGDNPNTLLGLRDLRKAVQLTRPGVEFVAPYQTVCNYLTYFFTPLGTHMSSTVAGGTSERILAKLPDLTQQNTLSSTESTHPVDVPVDKDPQGTPIQQALHTQYGGPAIDKGGRADCQSGQTGYPFRLVTGGRYPPDTSEGGFIGGGSHVVVDSNTPGLAGGTYTARRLGIRNLKDVP